MSFVISSNSVAAQNLGANGDIVTSDVLGALAGSNQISDRRSYVSSGDGDGTLESGEADHKLADSGYGGRLDRIAGKAALKFAGLDT